MRELTFEEIDLVSGGGELSGYVPTLTILGVLESAAIGAAVGSYFGPG